jgi:hypothetical protein
LGDLSWLDGLGTASDAPANPFMVGLPINKSHILLVDLFDKTGSEPVEKGSFSSLAARQ